MSTFNQDNSRCQIFTFKEGLLSKVAHDLQLKVNRYEVIWRDGNVEATFDPRSISVVHAMKRGRGNPRALSGGDKDKILENMHRDVLSPDRFPEIRFTADSVTESKNRLEVNGTLELQGVRRQVRATAAREGQEWVFSVPIHQPDFGIKPFSALMGTIKIKPSLTVRFSFAAK